MLTVFFKVREYRYNYFNNIFDYIINPYNTIIVIIIFVLLFVYEINWQFVRLVEVS